MSQVKRIEGLVAATCTPLTESGEVMPEAVASYVDYLVRMDIAGMYVMGTTGEGASLTGAERKTIAEAFVAGSHGRIPVIIQVGHNSVAEARELAAHAQSVGADAVSAFAPSYFKADSDKRLMQCMAEIAGGAPNLPFYYYHAPGFTGIKPDMDVLVAYAEKNIPNFAGVKFTDSRVHEYQACLEKYQDRYDFLWGTDEMLLSGLAAGARGAVGSTYNVAAPIYYQVIKAFREGDIEAAQAYQYMSVRLVEVLIQFPLFAALKEILGWNGSPLGPCRLPLGSLEPGQSQKLRSMLEQQGLLEHMLVSTKKTTVASKD